MISSSDIELPDYAEDFIDPMRYKGLRGGRDSAKTATVARVFILKMMEESARFLCVRYIKQRIKHSSYEILISIIHEYALNKYFYITNEEIICTTTGSKIAFLGLFGNSFEIKSYENFKYCWVEEAQNVPKEPLDILLPTIIRVPKCEIWFTWNPTLPTTPVEKIFENPAPNKLCKTVTYRDNPFFNEEGEEERQRCLRDDPENYMHIWEGQYRVPLDQNPVLDYQKLLKCRMKIPEQFLSIFYRVLPYMGLDPANGGQDTTAYALRRGSVLYEVAEKRLEDADKIADWIIPIADDQKIARCYYDAVGIGAGIQSQFATRKRKLCLSFITEPFSNGGAVLSPDTEYVPRRTNAQFFAKLSAQAWWNLRLRMHNTLKFLSGEKVNLERCLIIDPSVSDKTLVELAQVCFTYDASDRIVIEKKPKGTKSPNLAEAVMMSYARDLYFGLKASQ